MGKVIIHQVIDDITGSEVPEEEAATVFLSYRIVPPATGETDESTGEPQARYELFYGKTSLAQFRESIAAITKHAVPVEGAEPQGAQASRHRSNPENTTIRAWWRSLTEGQRMDLRLPTPPEKDRGRVPQPVIDAWKTLQVAGEPASAPAGE